MVLKNLRLRISAIVGNELHSADEKQALGIAVLVLGKYELLIWQRCIKKIVNAILYDINKFDI